MIIRRIHALILLDISLNFISSTIVASNDKVDQVFHDVLPVGAVACAKPPFAFYPYFNPLFCRPPLCSKRIEIFCAVRQAPKFSK